MSVEAEKVWKFVGGKSPSIERRSVIAISRFACEKKEHVYLHSVHTWLCSRGCGDASMIYRVAEMDTPVGSSQQSQHEDEHWACPITKCASVARFLGTLICRDVQG